MNDIIRKHEPFFMWMRTATHEALKTALAEGSKVRIIAVDDENVLSENFKRVTVEVIK